MNDYERSVLRIADEYEERGAFFTARALRAIVLNKSRKLSDRVSAVSETGVLIHVQSHGLDNAEEFCSHKSRWWNQESLDLI